jgi:hypothetical protein
VVTSRQAEERALESFVRVSRSGALMRIGVWGRSSGPHLRLLACCLGRVVGAATVDHDADGAPVLCIRVSAGWCEEGIRERLAEVASEVAADRGLKPISMRDDAPMAADLDQWLMSVDALNPAVP